MKTNKILVPRYVFEAVFRHYLRIAEYTTAPPGDTRTANALRMARRSDIPMLRKILKDEKAKEEEEK